jgi:hypothetical protein
MRIVRHFSIFMLAAAGISLPLQSQSAQPAVVANRITAPIDESNLVALRGNVHPMAQARFDRGVASSSMATGRMMLLLQRSAAQQQALTQYLADVQNPGSPSFHQWMTPAQYGAAFGISDSDLQTVESWLQAQGFKVENVPAARNAIQFSGTAGQVESAFHTLIHAFSVSGEAHYANVSDPQIPAALAAVVAGVTPLNDFHPKPHLVKGTGGHYDAAEHTIQPDLTLFSGSTPILFVDPADAATIYDTPNTNLNLNYTSGTTYDGTGVNIGLVGVSDLTLGDIANYRMAFLGETTTLNLPSVVVDGDDPGLNGGAVEALLDAEVSGGIAPKAKVYFYTSADGDLTSGLYNAVLRAIDDNVVSILSMSFGECEAGLGTSGNNFFFEEGQQAAAQGISFVVSAGDGGSAGCDDFNTETQAQYGLAASGMASTPWAIGVGGTDFDALPQSFSTYANATSSGSAPYYRTALKYIPENPWNDSTTVNTTIVNNIRSTNSAGLGNIIAGSGGVSVVYGKPSFQTSLTPADSARDVPDVSLFASNGFKHAVWVICSDNVTDGNPTSTYTDCQTSGGQLENGTTFEGAGGTSASAPAFAGMLALVSQAQGGARLGQADTIIYQLAKSKYATVFHDVTVGNNSVPCVSGSPNCGANGFLTGYNAGTGYDLATGLGSVDVKQMVTNWSSVALTSTATTMSLNGSTAAYTGVHGAAVNLAVGVTPTAATGAVAVIDTANETAGGTTSGPQNNGQLSIPLTSGAGTASYNGLPGGTYTVSARYGGDTSDASSSSTPISVTISPEASTTALQVNAYNGLTGSGISGLTTIPYGSLVVADAEITGTAEGTKTEGIATGSVTFADSGSTLGTANVSGDGNLASWPAPSALYVFPVGSHSVTAKYVGDASFNTSTSVAVAFTVVKAVTAMTGTAGVNTVNYTNPLTSATVTITTPYNLGVAPTGTVTMTANGSTVGTVSGLTVSIQGTSLSNLDWVLTGTGTINGALLAPGSNTVTLTYAGDGNYAATTTTLNITSSIGLGSFTLATGGNMTLVAGQSTPNTLSVTPAGGFYSSINFTCTSTGPVTCVAPEIPFVTGPGVVTSFVAVYTAIGGALGTYPVTVTGTDFSGRISASTTFNVTLTALPANAGISLTDDSGPMTINAGATNQTAVVIVTPTNGYVGNVNLTCAVTTNLANPTSPPTCTPGGVVSITGPGVAAPVSISTTSTTTAGAYTVTVTGTDASNAAITASTTIPLTITSPSAIALTNSGPVTMAAGATNQAVTVTVTPSNGYVGTVNLSCAVTTSLANPTSSPTCTPGAAVSITSTAAATSTVSISTTTTTTTGVYIVTVTGTDSTNATITGSTPIALTVSAPALPSISLTDSGNITVNPGATTGNTSTITVTPAGGFTGAVNMSCAISSSPSGATDLPTCAIGPVTISGTAAVTATLTVDTTAATSGALDLPLKKFFVAGGGGVLALVLFFGIPARRRGWRALFSLLAVIAVVGAIGCGGGGNSGGGGGGGGGDGGGGNAGTTAGAYTVTVTGADAATGKITSSVAVTVTVN